MNETLQIQHLPPEQVYKALGSHPQGLDSSEAAERLKEVGSNS